MSSLSPSSLASRQLWLTFWGGMALTPLLCLAMALWFFTASSAHSGPQLVRDAFELTGSVWLVATLPALCFCWLRLGAMRWLFGYYLAQPGAGRRALVVVGTLALFMALVLASALGLYLYWRGYIEWQITSRLCVGFGLPWLLAALGASWWVLRPGAASSAK